MKFRTIKKILSTICLSAFCLCSFAKKGSNLPFIFNGVNHSKMNAWVDSVYQTLSVDERIGQLIMPIAEGSLTEANKLKIRRWIENEKIGGILFSASTPQQQAELTNYAQSTARTPLMIALDGEWGLSMRLKNTTRFPRNMMLAATQNAELIRKYGEEVARQCRIMGIHVNFAPVLDVNSNPKNPVIGTRSYGENPDDVARWGIHYAQGLESGGILSVAKHFPGHGDTSTDSHHTLPVVSASQSRLQKMELPPFQQYISAGLGGMMVGHLSIPALDNSNQPSSLSELIVNELLVKKYGFKGLIFTDGLAMKGVANEVDMSVRALLAGNHILLGAANPDKEFANLKRALQTGLLTQDVINQKCRKVLMFKYILGLSKPAAVETKNLLARLNTPEAELLTKQLNEKAITLLKNDESIIPLKELDTRKIALLSLGGNADTKLKQTLALYASVTNFSASSPEQLSALENRLTNFNTVIISVNSTKRFSHRILNKIAENKNVILNFCTTPYEMEDYVPLVKKSSAVLCSYENTELVQQAVAQAIFGGIALSGKLPVSVQGLFEVGEGLVTQKVRLSYSHPEEVGISSERLASIDRIVNEGLNAKAYPGCQVLVAKQGVVVYHKAFGRLDYQGGRAVKISDIYDVASVTKATATVPAVMKLYDDGRIGSADRLSKYLSVLQGTDKEQITVRDALFHESGLKSFLPFYRYAQESAVTPFSALPSNDYPLQVAKGIYASPATRRQVLQNIINSPLKRRAYEYSDLNFILLAEAVEAISGENLSDFLQNNFYRKLGAYTSGYKPLDRFDAEVIPPTENDQTYRKQLLRGYVHDEAAALLGGISGNAGLFSSANDLAKIYQMWLNKGVYGGERYLSDKVCNYFTQAKSSISRRGMGFDKPDPNLLKGNPTSYSTPRTAYGHTGFTGTCFWIDPDNQLIYIFLSNRINESRDNKKLMSLNIRPRIQEAIYQSIIR